MRTFAKSSWVETILIHIGNKVKKYSMVVDGNDINRIFNKE